MTDINPCDAPDLADEMLEDLDDLCAKLGLTFFIHAGVCLGIYREGDYIEGDNDIDVAILANETEYSNLLSGLVKLGFQQSLVQDYELHHLRRNHILLDICRVDKISPYTVLGRKPYTFQEFDTINHFDRVYNVPGPTVEEYLQYSYGTWQIPKPKE